MNSGFTPEPLPSRISNQRLFFFVPRSRVEPVQIRGRRKLYDAVAQGRVLIEFMIGQENDPNNQHCYLPLADLRRLGAELGVLEEMRAVSGVWLTDRGEAMAASARASSEASWRRQEEAAGR